MANRGLRRFAWDAKLDNEIEQKDISPGDGLAVLSQVQGAIE